MRVLGINPNQALQHPGFYYYMAARCTERRRERFLAALESEVSPNWSRSTWECRSTVFHAQGEGTQGNSPGFANEKKVDHLTIALEVKSHCTLHALHRSGCLRLRSCRLAVHALIRAVQKMESAEHAEPEPRPAHALDRVPHRADV